MERTSPVILFSVLFIFSQAAGLTAALEAQSPGTSDPWQAWSAWSRTPGTIQLARDPAPASAGSSGGMQIRYTGGSADWAYTRTPMENAAQGEIWLLSVRARQAGPSTGLISMEAVLRDKAGTVTDWQAASLPLGTRGEWQYFETRLVVPPGCTSFQMRFSGSGNGDWLIDSPRLKREQAAFDWRSLPVLTVGNQALSLTADTSKGRLVLSGAGRAWNFDISALLTVTRGITRQDSASGPGLVITFLDRRGKEARADFTIIDKRIRMTLEGSGPLDHPQVMPGPLLAEKGDSWILPINQGLLVPSTDPYFSTWDLALYSGHGLCMPFFGLQDGTQSLLVMVDSPDDAKVTFTPPRAGIPSRFSLCWEPSRGEWAYPRTAWLVPLEGDYNQVAKAYRQHAASQGKAVTLKEKAARIPAVAKLKGAVNLWWWKNGPWWQTDSHEGVLAIMEELRKAGIDRVLWSHEQEAPTVEALAKAGFLAGRYDIYQDVWGPDNPHAWVNHEGWPDDLVLDQSGNPIKGWVDRDSDGKEYPGGAICSLPAVARARTHIAADLKDHPYGARFIDTTTASPLRECFNPLHPESRSDDRKHKMELLGMLGREFGLVAGSETGFDAAVPFLDYFEGMMSLGPYRLPDSGYDLFSYKAPDENFRRFQTGPFYRIPLFELVWHDCVANSWYWGDASNRVPELWDERDMLNALYGTLPLWAMDPAAWKTHKARFIRSWRNATPVSLHTGWSEMTEHRFLTPEHTVQETRFADGTRVQANFGTLAWKSPTGQVIPGRSFMALFGDSTILRSWEP